MSFALTVVFISLLPGLLAAKDYPVTFLKETYRAQAPATGPAKIYHTWAVESAKGNRLLILSGDDETKRQWLREFVKTGNNFIIKVPEKETGQFETETIFKVDVTNIHPVDESFVGGKKKKKKRRK
ncbi:MAG: hypothetical protein GY697_16640 [Desulfobacterales bacterium]|nr:hypothetical protein [Desulfobacterales bacterium]